MLVFIKRKIPLYYVALISIVFTGFAYVFLKNKMQESADDKLNVNFNTLSSTLAAYCNFHVERLSGFNYIGPVLFVETQCQSAQYASLKNKIVSYIELQKQTGNIEQASFYFRDTEKTEWAGYNEDEKYNPGSLMKVPELISYLRLEEDKPGTLNKEYFYAAPFITEKNPVFISKPLQPGKSYSVKELLQYMITYSDNNATVVLDQHLDQRYFKKTLTDLSLPIPDSMAINYPISPRDFSLFFRAIYNASYLTIPHSEYAAELLSTCNFKEGFAKGLPASVKMIHKFGESGSTQVHQLHESGIIYINNKPYILTVMTKGTDLKKLATVISDIAGIMYQQVSTS